MPYTRKGRKGKEFVVDGGETVHRGARPAETIDKEYTIKYVRHKVHGHVICSQANALPEYTTCYLQPCDVLLNKLIKDIARRNRI